MEPKLIGFIVIASLAGLALIAYGFIKFFCKNSKRCNNWDKIYDYSDRLKEDK